MVALGDEGGGGTVSVQAVATQADVMLLVVADVRLEAAEKVVQAVGRAGMKAVALARQVRPTIRPVRAAQIPSLFPRSECLASWVRIKSSEIGSEIAFATYLPQFARVLIV